MTPGRSRTHAQHRAWGDDDDRAVADASRGVKDPSGAVQKRPHAAHPKVRGMTRGIPWHRETVGENA